MEPSEDRAAVFTRLWTKVQPRVFAYIHALTTNWTDAEEVLQETGVVLWQKFDQFEPGTDFARWACGVAHYEVLKQRRRTALSHRCFSDGFLDVLAERAAAMLDIVSPLHEALNHCVEALSPSDRQLVSLRHGAGETTNGIAAQLHRSPEGVRKSLQRIHRVLFDCVERWRRQEEHP
jgi:RNA polymerase sigma-70 factor, ECF subfamily